MILDMGTRSAAPCQKLSALFRGAVPAPLLCVLAVLLLPAHALAQTDRPARPSPAPEPPVVDAAGGAAVLSAARGGGPAIQALAAPGLATSDAGEALLARALGGPSSGEEPGPDLSSLRDFLPRGLYHDVLELRDRVVKVRSRVFGRRGIVSVGEADEEGEVGRLRLNLQYSPDPGIRVTLITR